MSKIPFVENWKKIKSAFVDKSLCRKPFSLKIYLCRRTFEFKRYSTKGIFDEKIGVDFFGQMVLLIFYQVQHVVCHRDNFMTPNFTTDHKNPTIISELLNHYN